MCQSRSNSQVFAACSGESNTENMIMLFKWLGTLASEPQRAAVKVLATVPMPEENPVIRMCFVSNVPARVAQADGQVLIMLVGTSNPSVMQLCIVSVYGTAFEVESSVIVEGCTVEGSPQRDDGTLEIAFMQCSHSGRLIALGGSRMLNFYSIQEVREELEDGEVQDRLQLSLLENCAASYPDICATDLTSCVCLPPPRPRLIVDWIVVGASDGSLYGFRFDLADGELVALSPQDCGRFRRNPHADRCSAIRLLVPTFGTEPRTHMRSVQERGISYFRFLKQAPYDNSLFYSVGEDGTYVTWELTSHGWTATNTSSLPELSCKAPGRRVAAAAAPKQGKNRYVAACSARLAPHMGVVVDLHERQFLVMNREPSGEPLVGATCNLASS